MTIASQVQNLDHDHGIVTLCSIDATALGGSIFYFTHRRNGTVLFNGQSYLPLDFKLEGLEIRPDDEPATPTLSIETTDSFIPAFVRQFSDGRGAVFTRMRTYELFLDNGSSPDPAQTFSPEIYYIERKARDDRVAGVLEWELSSILDQEGLMFPVRQVIQNYCDYLYRRWSDDLTTDLDLRSFAASVPRITNRGLLNEPTRTNLLTRSQDFADSAWTKAGCSQVGGFTAPDGTATASSITGDPGNTSWLLRRTSAFTTVTSGTTYTYSMFLKRGNFDWITLRVHDSAASGNGVFLWANLATGVLGSNSTTGTGYTFVSGTIGESIDGYYRVSMTFTPTTTSVECCVQSGTADGLGTRVTDGVFYVWGGMLEAGTYATSYIATTTASVARGGETITITGFDIATPLTVYVDSEPRALGSSQVIVQIDDGTTSNRVFNFFTTSSNLNSSVTTGGVSQASLNNVTPAVARTRYRMATRYDTNNTRAAVDGVLKTLDSACTMPTGLTTLRIGSTTSSAPIIGYVRRIAVIPRALSDTELQLLSGGDLTVLSEATWDLNFAQSTFKTSSTSETIDFLSIANLTFSRSGPGTALTSELGGWIAGECPYNSRLRFYDRDGIQRGDPSKDVCGKRLSDCKVRFGQTSMLPYRGFPGVTRMR